MPDIEPVEKPSVVRLRPASNPSLDLGSQPPGDDWLCLSWLDRSEYTTTIKRTSSERPTLAGYEIRRELGQGSLGTVYLARDPRLKRRVAIKLMRENLVEAGAVGTIPGRHGSSRQTAASEHRVDLWHGRIPRPAVSGA